uniref:Proteasome subunit beta n=1 Tax=Arcella intermedia TaxID=1963864 RepID=A0A6B2LJ98_9EUKA
MGTSIIAIVYKDGVIMGADSRTSTGQYIANRASNKITAIHDKIFVCRSGSAADTQAISDFVKFYLDMHTAELGTLPLVRTAAALVQQLSYQNKEQLLAAMIIGGWDPINGGSVWEVTLGGSRVQLPWSISGSGSSYIYGFCDTNFRQGMTKEQGLQFVRTALSLAMSRDGSSGGVIRTVVITKDGVERDFIPGNKVPNYNDL